MTHRLVSSLPGTRHEELLHKRRPETNTISPKAPRATLSSAGRQPSSAGRHCPQQDGTPVIHHLPPADGSPVHTFNPQNPRTATIIIQPTTPWIPRTTAHPRQDGTILNRTAPSSSGQHTFIRQRAQVPPDTVQNRNHHISMSRHITSDVTEIHHTHTSHVSSTTESCTPHPPPFSPPTHYSLPLLTTHSFTITSHTKCKRSNSRYR
jgi:hypothetical protein